MLPAWLGTPVNTLALIAPPPPSPHHQRDAAGLALIKTRLSHTHIHTPEAWHTVYLDIIRKRSKCSQMFCDQYEIRYKPSLR